MFTDKIDDIDEALRVVLRYYCCSECNYEHKETCLEVCIDNSDFKIICNDYNGIECEKTLKGDDIIKDVKLIKELNGDVYMGIRGWCKDCLEYIEEPNTDINNVCDKLINKLSEGGDKNG